MINNTFNITNLSLTENTIIYTRISTLKQTTGTSLDSQLSLCQSYCEKNNYKIIKTYAEVSTATDINKQKKLLEIVNYKNINLVILEPSRFSRNLTHFIEILNKCKKNNIILHFVHDELISTSNYDMKIILSKILDSQNESEVIGTRIKRSVNYRKINKVYYPSISKYGYKYNKNNKKLEMNDYEQNIITLIKKLYHGSNFLKLEKLLLQITNKKHELCFNDNETRLKYGNMWYKDISNFLNSISILRRNKKWSPISVSRIINKNK